jgi:hypothetical protein
MTTKLFRNAQRRKVCSLTPKGLDDGTYPSQTCKHRIKASVRIEGEFSSISQFCGLEVRNSTLE